MLVKARLFLIRNYGFVASNPWRREANKSMRIIAGKARGMRLNVPRAGVRPTTDRTKAALFSWIGEAIEGAAVLDLFAGAGGLGIEALSRGAAEVTFVESHRPAVAVIERNLDASQTRQQARIVHSKVETWVGVAARHPSPRKWDFIFADPPWVRKPGDFDYVAWLVGSVDLPRLLASGGWLVVESPSDGKIVVGGPWLLIDMRRYGTTTLCYLQLKGEGE